MRHGVLIVRTKHGFTADIAFGGLPFEELAIAQATDFEYAPGVVLRVCSSNDLVVMKAFAGRLHDWADIEASSSANKASWTGLTFARNSRHWRF